MRTFQDQYFRVDYPDEVGFAFSQNIVRLTTDEDLRTMTIAMTTDGKTKTYTVDAHNGVAIANISAFIQAFFDGVTFGMDYTKDFEQSQLGKSIQLTVSCHYVDGSEELGQSLVTASIFYVWGALAVGEVYNERKRLTWFSNYPYSVGLYVDAETPVLIGGKTITLPNAGVFNVPVSGLPTSRTQRIVANYKRGSFDNFFDFTFSLISGDVLTTLDVDNRDQGLYLRWIDRQGFYRYWLFDTGEDKRTASADGEYMRNNLLQYDDKYGYQGASGRRQRYSREDSMEICAPLVDRDTFDLLQDIATSPVVDRWMGDNNWSNVTIKAATYSKSTAELQDFTATLVLPEIPIQSL